MWVVRVAIGLPHQTTPRWGHGLREPSGRRSVPLRRNPFGYLSVRERLEEHRRPRGLGEVEIVVEVAEDREVLAHRRPRVGTAVGLRVEALATEEPVLDELQVGVEA